jgi:hypothetical protein
MAVTDWIQTAAAVYFAWQQNRIFRQQNQIFANQAGHAAMPKTSQAPWIAQYWPTVVMVGLMALTGYDIYARHGAPPVVPWWFYVILLLIVAVAVLAIGRLTTKTTPHLENPEAEQLKDEVERIKQEKTDLEAKYLLENREKKKYQEDLAIAEGKAEALQSASLAEKPKYPSKLAIHWANYQAVDGGGEVYQVGEFLHQIICGDSLVFDIENHNFVIGDKNFVPRDPLFGKQKRLQVNYSYGGSQPVTTERREHGRLLLPEDSKINWLMGETARLEREVKEWKEKYLAENVGKNNVQKELARAENRPTEDNRSRLPLTALQIEAIRLSSELLDFLKRIGPAPAPRYTAAQINDMSSAQTKVLIQAQDGDFFDACEYHFGHKNYFGQTAQGLENESTARVTRMYAWYQKLEAAYALEGLKEKVERLRNRFVVEGVAADALIVPIPYKDSEKHIRSIAAKLWELAYKAGDKR